MSYDAIIVGGGPAGLSAALILGRCRRRVLVCDAGNPRNAASHGLHGFLTRDGIPPGDFLGIGRRQLSRYGVEFRKAEVVAASRRAGRFVLRLKNGSRLVSRMLVLATGVLDRLPGIEGFREHYGRSVFHCPYCDGWEVRDKPLAVYGRSAGALGLALSLTTWSKDVVLCTDGRARLTTAQRKTLSRNHVRLREEKVMRLEGRKGALRRVVFRRGPPLSRAALFFATGQYQRSALAESLGCEFNRKGTVKTDRFERTCVPGLFCVGDASEDVQLVIVAAAEGAKAAFALNAALQKEDRK